MELQQMLDERPIYYYEEIDSTNTEAKRLGISGADSGTLVVADCQTSGKGRRGRMWESPKGASIYMSLLLRPEIRPDRASMLTLVMGLSVVQAIQQISGVEAGIKWPNDVVLNKKKLVGILTEMSARPEGIEYVVIGVGVNANTTDFPEQIVDKATSLKAELGKSIHRPTYIAAIIKTFEKNYQIFRQTQDLSGLMKDYEKVLLNQNQPVRVLEPGNEYEGIARGINNMGELLVEKENGRCEAVYAGEVSVRGLYSYV